MKMAALTAVMAMALLAGCKGDSAVQGVAGDPLSIIKQANGVLLGVRDADTARAAKPKLQELTVQLRDAAAELKKAGKGPPANADDRTAAGAQELTGNALRIKADPALNGVIGADLDAFMKVMTGQG